MVAPVATTAVAVRVIFFRPLIWPTLAHCGAAVNVRGYLVSPAMTAATAIAGHFVDVPWWK
jgi:hypothetical protein